MNYMIVDDDEYTRDAIHEIIAEIDPNSSIKAFESICDAHFSGKPVDVLIIDVSSVVPIALAHTAWSAICQFLLDRPGVTVIINSNCSRGLLEDVREDILRRNQDAHVLIAGFPFHQTLPAAIRTLQ